MPGNRLQPFLKSSKIQIKILTGAHISEYITAMFCNSRRFTKDFEERNMLSLKSGLVSLYNRFAPFIDARFGIIVV